MFRTKVEVDRHVQTTCRKLSESETTLRGYNFGKLYYQVEEYETAKRYVSSYLSVRDDSAPAHKLLGQIYEALGQKERALDQYKISLELEGKQDELVLKVCELLADMDISMDTNRVRYWLERADKVDSTHPVIFQLKEKLLTSDKSNGDGDNLEALIAAELRTRPTDVNMRIKLLKYYLDKNRLEDAYKHAVSVEATFAHRNSVIWYQTICEIFAKYKASRAVDWLFWVIYVSSMERFAALSLIEQGNVVKKSLSEATQAVLNFDQSIQEMKQQNFSMDIHFTDLMLKHMWGQLHYHLACLILRKTKREQGIWSETGRLCAPLFLGALHTYPVDPSATWINHLKEPCKSQVRVWYKEANYRCSQSGHVLQDYIKTDVKRLMDKIDQFCTGSWRERIYQRIFVSRLHQSKIVSSFFVTHNLPDPPLRFCSQNELDSYDKISEEVWPASLHHNVWLGVKSKPLNSADVSAPHPHRTSHVFPQLQLSVYNLSQAAPDSLSRLDIDAFLNAAVLCANAIVEDQQRSGFLNPDRLPTLPADITETLCTTVQEKWWSAAYRMYSSQDQLGNDIGEIRQDLQRGLEVIRCIGNHGLHPKILVHLARIFHYRVKLLEEKNKEHNDISALEARSELYWNAAIPLLERLQNNRSISMTSSNLFKYQGKDMNNVELTNALEEGKLVLARRNFREKQHENAIEILQSLKSPDASFLQGQIYKTLADEIVSSLPRESLTSEMRSQHIIMLTKARNSYYLTLDRLRSPEVNPQHPLNSELGSYISDIENELKRIDPDLWRNDLNRNECDGMSEESYSSAHSGVEQPTVNASTLLGIGNSINMSTPQRATHRTPKQSSTPGRPHHQDVLELSRNRSEARPSPERLDAQLRQLIHSKDNNIQVVMEQTKIVLEIVKDLQDKWTEVKKEITDVKNDIKELREEKAAKNRTQSLNQMNMPNIEQESDIPLEDYGDLAYGASTSLPPNATIPGGLYPPTQRQPYSGFVYPPAPPFQNYYQGATMPFNDPTAQPPIPSLYPRSMYPMSVICIQGKSKMPDNVFQQNLYQQQLAELVPPLNQQQTVGPPMNQQLNVGLPLNQQQTVRPPLNPQQTIGPPLNQQQPPVAKESLLMPAHPKPKDNVINKAPPVNVVITSSDTLPSLTTAPLSQPALSVTIPPQHRMGSVPFAQVKQGPPVPSVFAPQPSASEQFPKSQPDPLHNFHISMPSQAIIPTTVNLPPLTSTLTTTSASTSEQTQTKADESLNTSSEYVNEPEHDPIPDFVPVVPLPAEVKITTGEEDETTLYCARAKLFRFVDKEWKERGIGNVKLLRNSEGKVRLLMRREQVHKICANHLIRSDMELTPMANNDKAWMWVANDFADEEVKLEKLCIRFKTTDEAANFKESFDKAKADLVASPEKPKEKPSEKEQENEKDKKDPSASVVFGGFSFTTTPIIQKEASTESVKTPQKTEQPPKTSPFTGFQFTPTDAASKENSGIGFSFGYTSKQEGSKSLQGFSLGKSPTLLNFSSANNQSPAVSGDNGNNKTFQFSSGSFTFSAAHGPPTLRRPHTPAPAEIAAARAVAGAVSSNQANEDKSKPDDEKEGELILFEQQATLRYFDNASQQWKDRGFGKIKILRESQTGKTRLLMRHDITSAICCNHPLLTETKFTSQSDGNTTINWYTQDYSSGETVPQNFAITFKAPEQAAMFHKIILENQQRMICDQVSAKKAEADKSKSLAEMFKPAADSWECDVCYTRNDGKNANCLACENPQPTASVPKEATAAKEPAALPSQSASSQVSLSQLFKPSEGSWKCDCCYVCNESTATACIACGTANPKSSTVTCDTPKDLTMPPKPKTTGFYIPGSSSSSSTSTFPTFSISTLLEENKRTFPITNVENKASSEKMIFGVPKKDDNVTKFTFGVPKTTPTGNSPFTFGSPGKSFDFQFQSKSPTSPGAAGEQSEEEVCESDDVYFQPVIPLPDKIDVVTGEENEEILYSHRAKLFRFDSGAKEWKERGIGDIKLLRHKENAKLRLIMRRDQILKLCLNHAVPSDLELAPKDDKTWFWSAYDYSEGEIEYTKFACRFKTAAIAMEFKEAFDSAQKSDGKNSETSSSKPSSDSKDIEVLYELKVTPEEKAEALKHQLPENFYAYKSKEDCPGCRGCAEPPVPLFEKSPAPSRKSIALKPSIIETKKETAALPTSTSTSTTTTASFGTPSLTFGTDKSDKKATFSFGSVVKTPEIESLKICSPSAPAVGTTGTTTLTSPFFAPAFGFTIKPTEKSDTSLLDPPSISSSTTGTKLAAPKLGNLSTPSSTGYIFGNIPAKTESAAAVTTTSTTITTAAAATTTTTSSTTPLFGAKSNVAGSVFGGFTNMPLIFGGTSQTNSFGTNNTSTGLTFGSAGSGLFGSAANTTSTSGNIFSGKAPETQPQKEEGGAMKLFSANNGITFSSLAAEGPKQEAFKKDPNFSFAGAGAAVFGAKPADSQTATVPSSSKVSDSNTGAQAEDNEDDQAGDDGQEHDPHYDPIIPLPDCIEVRTGEEDEEKVFCQRAKLYRYSNKEWKERGVGEMKILYHAEHGTYRLLMRREQVHKIVCNILLTPDIEFCRLNSSDRAWMWAGMNFAEESCIEELAVRFKTPELAASFKEAVDEAQQVLRKKKAAGDTTNKTDVTNESVQEDEEEVDENEEDELDEENEEDDEEDSVLFEKRASLHTESQVYGNKWDFIGWGNLLVCYDSNFFGYRILFKFDDDPEESVSSTVISMKTRMEINNEECIWSAVDDALDPPTRRTLKVVFTCAEDAEELYRHYLEGLNCAKEVELSEPDPFPVM